MKRIVTVVSALTLSLGGLSGCANMNETQRTTGTGAAIGAKQPIELADPAQCQQLPRHIPRPQRLTPGAAELAAAGIKLHHQPVGGWLFGQRGRACHVVIQGLFKLSHLSPHHAACWLA